MSARSFLFDSLKTLLAPALNYLAVSDLISHLTSTNWLLSQPVAFQQTHIPLPFEETTPPEQAQPLFPIRIAFGEPLKGGGWKNTKPSWVQVIPQMVTLKVTTPVRIQPYLC